MNVNRRNLTKAVGSTLLLPIAGCLKSSSEKLNELVIEKNGNSISITQNTTTELNNLEVRLKSQSLHSDSTKTLQTFQLSDLTKNNNKYTTTISKDKIYSSLPEDEPVELYAESKLDDYVNTSEMLTSLDRPYYMLKYYADSEYHYVDTDTVEKSIEDDTVTRNTIHHWESEDTIHFKIFFTTTVEQLEPWHRKDLTMTGQLKFVPFLFDLSLSKDKKKDLENLKDKGVIEWSDFSKEFTTESTGTTKYYELSLIKSFASQLQSQMQTLPYDLHQLADIKLVLRFFNKMIDYDYAKLGSYNTPQFLFQTLSKQSCICQGTTFNIAGILYQLGYNVGSQLLVEKPQYDYPNGYHIEPTVEVPPHLFDSLAKESFGSFINPPDKTVNGITQSEIRDQMVLYPAYPIGVTERVIDTRAHIRVQNEYVKADS